MGFVGEGKALLIRVILGLVPRIYTS